MLRALTSDIRTLAINLLTLALDQLKENVVSIDEIVTNNAKTFVNTNLNQHSNSATDAKYAVALASLCNNPDNFNRIKVRLGAGSKICKRFIHSNNDSACYAPIDHSKELSTLQKLQRQCIFQFCHSDDASRIDSNSSRCMNVTVNGMKEWHVGRAWDVSNLGEKCALFFQSETLSNYLSFPNFKTPSISTLCKYHCKCLSNPTVQSCVDVIKSKLYYYCRAIFNDTRSNPALKSQLHTCSCLVHRKQATKQWLSHLNTPLEKFIYFSCCPRMPHPNLKCEDFIPTFLDWKCANGCCDDCGPDTLGLFDCPILNQQTRIMPCNEWHLAPRPGSTTQLDLGSFKHTIPIILQKLHSALGEAIKHQANLRWKAHCFRLDCTLSNPTTTLLVATDFGASLDL